MIINKKNKIIFIKTKKTAGTSFEIALSAFCGDDCIITPITPSDENLRFSLGFKTAQNYKNHVWDNNGAITNGTFFNHLPALNIKNAIPPTIWESYKKITIVRNPYDVAISRYYWEGGERTGLNFEEYLRKFPDHLYENTQISSIDNKVKLDTYLRYENLKQSLNESGLGYLWDIFCKIKAKSNKRPSKGTSIENIYKKFPNAIDIVKNICKQEFQEFNYNPNIT